MKWVDKIEHLGSPQITYLHVKINARHRKIHQTLHRIHFNHVAEKRRWFIPFP